MHILAYTKKSNKTTQQINLRLKFKKIHTKLGSNLPSPPAFTTPINLANLASASPLAASASSRCFCSSCTFSVSTDGGLSAENKLFIIHSLDCS